MPSVKRKLVQLEKERAKIAINNHCMTSFFGARASDETTQATEAVFDPAPVRQEECQPPVSTTSTPKQRKTLKAKHKIGFESAWTLTRPWLYNKHESEYFSLKY
ncbi:uncharacterized protein LOC123564482 [Mercenaria mercenaria]|uniref:uncharacterized protein LOC123564482 n=1 Tax=Mercenaria mercenaria TaxID=6596 RepID=UPI00234FA943|nr:uncharacterized protein LOC123564482 [Mercenaria mercenaria]